MQLILIFPVCLLLPHAASLRAWSVPADYQRLSMQIGVAGLARTYLSKRLCLVHKGKGQRGHPVQTSCS